MTVAVLLFARYGEVAGVSAIEVELPPGATLAQVWEAVQARVPGLRDDNTPLLARDRIYARPDQVVGPGDEIAAFPPVSGG